MVTAESSINQKENPFMEMLTTMITPYTGDGAVDYETAERYVDFYFNAGLDGIFAVCQSSEIFFLTLEERVELNRRVYARAKELERSSGKAFTVVSSGHISDTLEDQAKELNAIYASGTDALILITNRLDPDNLGDDVFIENLEKLMKLLPADAKLGFYECPYPYKRLVTPRILEYCKSTGRFYYMKDTCCDAKVIAERVKILEGSEFKLLNANCQTLLESLRLGADGYCGIMCNYHPRLYAHLAENYESAEADKLQALIGPLGYTEAGIPYPLSAKYHMTLCGIETNLITRNPACRPLSEYDKASIRQLKLITDEAERALGYGG
jgi:4-hydroxy-tetrahydrodipicolinate synthase